MTTKKNTSIFSFQTAVHRAKQLARHTRIPTPPHTHTQESGTFMRVRVKCLTNVVSTSIFVHLVK